jgi:hypothetical protein
MNNIVRDEIELTDAELAGIYGAGEDDVDEKPEFKEHKEHKEKEEPCVDIFIICERKHHHHHEG